MKTTRSLLALVSLAALAATSDSTIPWTELTEADALARSSVRKAAVAGHVIYYETPPKERAEALESLGHASGPDANAALRHLAEARREAGDLPGAEAALQAWASGSGPGAARAWDEAARWGARYRRWSFAFASAAKALDARALPDADAKALASDRITWADAHPEAADRMALLAARASLFPDEPGYLEEWVRALEAKGKLADAEAALASGAALPPERRAVLSADLRADHGDKDGAVAALRTYALRSEAVPSPTFARELARRMDETGHGAADALRARLESAWDRDALVVLELYLQGRSRGDLAHDLLTQVELRYSAGFDRAAWLEVSRLWASIDGVPEAFRARLAAAKGANDDAERADLDALARLALRAGGRALPWGTYNDEAYRWAARVDVTPGFWTGGLSFLLTGFGREAALAELEARRLPDRTFVTAKALVAELARRAPEDPRLPALHLALMQRHVERGEGTDALALLPLADKGDVETRAAARKTALLAMRQAKRPLSEETRLWKERLALLAPDGTRPAERSASSRTANAASGDESGAPRREPYLDVLNEAITRLDTRDPKHQTSLALLLGELDRLPESEPLWLTATSRIASWNLDDALETRYRKALDTFGGPEWWNRLARWYTRRKRQTELKALVDEIVARFRGTELFGRDPKVTAVVPAADQPNPFLQVSDYLRLKALQRFPWSPLVVREAETRLLLRSSFDAMKPKDRQRNDKRGTMDDALFAARKDAVIFADPARRSGFLDVLMRDGALETFLLELEKSAEKTPVHDRLLLDGWARLSRFEHAVAFADRLADAYPGVAEPARDAMTLHRSLSLLVPAHAAGVQRVAERAVPSLENARETLVALGETWQDLDRGEPAGAAWRQVVEQSPRDPSAILEIATVFWDYGRMREAWEVLEAGRKRLDRPRMNAFEAGVLKEELKDVPGALDEYLAAAFRGEQDWNAGEWSGGGEWRARERLARLVARPRVEELLARRLDALTPGRRADEESLVTLSGILALVPEEPCSCEDWIDLPNDPVGREARVATRTAARPKEATALARLGTRVFARTMEMIPKATRVEFLAAVRERAASITDRRWTADASSPVPAADVTLETALLQREAELAPDLDGRIAKEVALADYLMKHERLDAARKLWKELPARIDRLPDGAAKLRHLAAGARFAEASGGDAAAAWAALSARAPRSLGVLEDRLEFLFRTARTKEALDLLEDAASRAASGHKENLTERLAKESLDHADLPRGKRALSALLAMSLPDERRATTAGLLARVSLKEGGAFDALALGRAEAAKVKEDVRPDLWAAIAEAARDEGKPALAVDLLIESLNLRLDRARLEQACRLAVSAGTDAHLLKFFDAQRKRSPRDVRWAVAVREIKTFAGDLAGAIEAAKEATAVAPERESLQEEAVQLYLRAGRPRDAAEFLETWQRPRKGDEKVAGWRASLYVKAGDVPRALAIERESLEAWRASTPRTPEEGNERIARAARRFLALNRAEPAWLLMMRGPTSAAPEPPGAIPKGDLASARAIPLSHAERTELAIRTGHLVKLVRAFEDDVDFRNQAPSVIRRLAKPEQKAELERALVASLFPEGRRDEARLDVVWDFARDAGLDRMGEAVAARLVASPSKPWGEHPPVAFLRMIEPVVPSAGAEGGTRRWLFSREDFRKPWVEYLVSRDRLLVLAKTLEPLVAELDRRVSSPESAPEPVGFARWFPVEAFARIAATPGHEPWRAMVTRWLATANASRRLSAVTEGKWDMKPLVELVDEPTRAAYLARMAPKKGAPKTATPDPLLAKRDISQVRVSTALAALVEDAPGAVAAPDIVRLRGPRTVGEVLGDDARFAWNLFAPRKGEKGEDAITGAGADRLRFPGRLWGERPGEAWYVLEALARLRERDPLAPLVPLESAARGREAERTLLAVRTAEALSEMPLALALDEQYFADLANLDRLGRRLHLLVASGRDADARALFVKEVRARQARLKREDWLVLTAIAATNGLDRPFAALDETKPVSAGILAYLVDEEPDAAVSRLSPTDVAEFRAALAGRWYSQADRLPPAKTVRYLDELWATGAGRYPEAAARRLGPWFAKAERFLSPLDVRLRSAALAAVRALPDPHPLEAFADAHVDRRDETERLLASAELAAGDEARALGRLDRALTEIAVETPPAPPANPDLDGEGVPADDVTAPVATTTDVPRFTAWLRAFREGGRPAALATAESKLSARVKRDLDAGPAPFAVWSLALELVAPSKPAAPRDPAALARVVGDLERSWARGEWPLDGDRVALVRALTPRDAEAARRWYARLDEAGTFSAASIRASLLADLGDPTGARREWESARTRLALDARDEVRAFDAWRHLPVGPPAEAPALWVTARRFWTLPAGEADTWGADLARHLADEPYDVLAARAMLRALSPVREGWMAPASPLLGRDPVAAWRVMRAELPRSARAARAAMPDRFVDVDDLVRRRFRSAEIDALLVDVARAAARNADRELLTRVLGDLTERRFAGLVALRAELGAEALKAGPRPETVRRENGRLVALRPRDLTWDLYARVLDAEGTP